MNNILRFDIYINFGIVMIIGVEVLDFHIGNRHLFGVSMAYIIFLLQSNQTTFRFLYCPGNLNFFMFNRVFK